MSFIYYLILFFIYSFIGWVWETTYCSIIEHRFINRGFLHGPLCPVYGFGGMIVMYLLKPIANTWLLLFLTSIFLLSVLEYFTSWILEKIFHTKWWDYSKTKFNLNGRICLKSSVCFGIMGTLAAHFLHPFLEKTIFSIPLNWANIIGLFLLSIFVFDTVFTAIKLANFSSHMANLKEFLDSLKRKYGTETWFQEKNHSVSALFEALKFRIKDEKLTVSENFLKKLEQLSLRQQQFLATIKKYPAMKSLKFKAGIEDLRHRLKLEQEKNKGKSRNQK